MSVIALGGDEFGLLLEGCDENQALRIATEIIAAVGDFQTQEGILQSVRAGLRMDAADVQAREIEQGVE